MLDWLLISAPVALVVFSALPVRRVLAARNRHQGLQTLEFWEQVAAKAGVRLAMKAETAGLRLEGKLENLPLSVEIGTPGLNNRSWIHARVIIDARGKLPFNLTLLRRGGPKNQTAPRRETIQTGDETFDRLVQIQGDRIPVTVLLDHRTRKTAKAFIGRHGGYVAGGRIVFLTGALPPSPETIAEVVRLMQGLARGLSRCDGQVADRLLENIRTERHEGIRKKLHQMLFENFPESVAARNATHAALSDSDPVIRIYGAIRLGEDGFQALQEAIEDRTLDPEARVHATQHFVQKFRGRRAREVIAKALESSSYRVKNAALEAISSAAHPEFQFRLLSMASMVAGSAEDLETLSRVIRALNAIGDPQSESVLIKLLQHENIGIALAAAEGLGKVGTPRSVEPLVLASAGMFKGRARKYAAEEALRQIRTRLGEPGHGRLSLTKAENDAGRLSDAHAGSLSLKGG